MKLSSAITINEESLLSEEERKDRVSFSICLDDTDKDDKVKTYVTKFGSGSAEDWLRFLQEAKKVSDSKGWASKPKQLHAMYGILFKGQAEALYTRLMTSTVTPSPALDVRIKDAIDKMTLEYLPIDCRYLSQVKKPYEMSVEAFYNRIKAIDAYLPLMPGPMNASLGRDQLFSLVENSVPQEWRHKLHLHQTLGKDLEISTMIQYFKILEINETKSKQNPMTPKGEKAKKNQTSRRHQGRESSDEDTNKTGKKTSSPTVPVRTSQRKNPTGKWCAIHKTTSHNTSECRSAAKEAEHEAN